MGFHSQKGSYMDKYEMLWLQRDEARIEAELYDIHERSGSTSWATKNRLMKELHAVREQKRKLEQA